MSAQSDSIVIPIIRNTSKLNVYSAENLLANVVREANNLGLQNKRVIGTEHRDRGGHMGGEVVLYWEDAGSIREG